MREVKQEVHVVPYRKVWAVEASGVTYLEFATQDIAVNFAKNQAKQKHLELFVHDATGEVVAVDFSSCQLHQHAA